ncbi:MAG: polysaccharide deacetylase family protein [Clostridia bacterium]|jgi:peptidoglycan-N-acetylmuramic acid deacetylase|nr:polysaccharide deacetylase family protein [Clostridia bacterium]
MTISLRKNISKITKLLVLLLIIFSLSIINSKKTQETSILTSSQGLSNQKIEWGIKRSDNHQQPDLGSKNRQVLEKNNGIAMGNKEDKYIYLTFDEGYEAGYTPQILKTLKENNVIATFFLTAHYLNTQPELVKQMIDEGQIVRKSYSKS